MKKRVLCLVLPILTLILEIVPYGAVCIFARPANDDTTACFRKLYSYFDLLPFGYANFAPFITAILTCIIILIIILYCVTGKKKIAVVARNILSATSAISLGPLVFGISYFSFVGTLITVSLIAELLLLHFNILQNRTST